MRLLVTRPQPDGERTAAALRTRGHDVLAIPLMRIEPLAADFGPGPFDAVAITSANAARALAGHPRAGGLLNLPLYAVGERSAEAARAAGFTRVLAQAGDLAKAIATHHGRGTLLYLAGDERARDLAEDLQAGGVAVRLAVLYRAVALPFPASLGRAISTAQIEGAVHFSKRSTTILLQGVKDAGLLEPFSALRHYCLSAQVAAPLSAANAPRVAVAARPDEAALLDLIGP